MVKSERIQLTYVIGGATFFDLPKIFERDTVIEGKVSLLYISLLITFIIIVKI